MTTKVSTVKIVSPKLSKNNIDMSNVNEVTRLIDSAKPICT